MTIRSDQKAYLVNLLKTITPAPDCYGYIQTSNKNYPYICVTSGGMIPNVSSGTNIRSADFGTYRRGYQYVITVVHQFSDVRKAREVELEVDNYEALVLDKLQARTTRDGGANNLFLDLYIEQISPTIDGLDINIAEGTAVKMFTITLETLTDF